MSEYCEACPIKGACLRYPVWCEEWAPSGDPVKLAHIRNRSTGVVSAPTQPVPLPPSAAEGIALARAMKACPYRSTDVGCGCNGGRCALRGGAIVSHIDCFACLKEYPVAPA